MKLTTKPEPPIDYLLTGLEPLTKPDFNKMNQQDGRNDRLLHAVLCAYVKHVMGIDDIGWNELGDILHSVICNEIGDDNYQRWVDTIKDDHA